MVDTFTRKERSKIMSSIHSTHTKPELMVKRALRGMGFSYQPKIKGSPDFINRKKKVTIFVNGCFWHGCTICNKIPKTNKSYWLPKIKRNVERDKQNRNYLRLNGYRVVTIWEHQLKSSANYKEIRILLS